MVPHTIVLQIHVSLANYRDASRLLRAGNLNANPLTLALLELSAYHLVNCTDESITLRQVATGRRYTGGVPAVLADYLAGLRRGRRVLEDHVFELVLESEGG